MKKVFVSLIAILALAVSAYSMDLPHSRHVADAGSAYELTLATSVVAPTIVTAPVAWLSASYLRCSRPTEAVMNAAAAPLADHYEKYANEHRAFGNHDAIGNRSRAATIRRLWRVWTANDVGGA